LCASIIVSSFQMAFLSAHIPFSMREVFFFCPDDASEMKARPLFEVRRVRFFKILSATY